MDNIMLCFSQHWRIFLGHITGGMSVSKVIDEGSWKQWKNGDIKVRNQWDGRNSHTLLCKLMVYSRVTTSCKAILTKMSEVVGIQKASVLKFSGFFRRETC